MNISKGQEHIETSRGRGVSQGSVRIHALYENYSIICADATGSLYKAEHAVDGHKVAIKVLAENIFVDKTLPGTIRQKNLVTVEAVLTSPTGDTLVVVPRPHGTVLDKLLSKQGRLKRAHAISIAMRLLSVLQKLHDAGRLHNSISPKTIFLSRTAGGRIDVDILYLGLLGDAAALNDLRYLSPEQATDFAERHPASDLFAVGIILHEMLFGQHPFAGRTEEETLGRILLEEILLPAAFRKEEAALADIIERALHKNPAERFQTAAEMIEALASVREETRSASDSLASLTPFTQSEKPPSPRSFHPMPPPISRRIPSVPRPSAASRPVSMTRAEIALKTPALVENDEDPITVVEENPIRWDIVDEVPSRIPALASTQAPPALPVTSKMVSEDHDLTNPSIKPCILAIEERRYIAHSRRTRKIFGVSLCALLIAAAASVILMMPRLWDKPHKPAIGPRVDTPATEAANSQGDPPASRAVVETGSPPPRGNDEVGSVPEPVPERTPSDAANDDEVVIEIDDLPENAVIKIGKRRVHYPIVMTRSDAPVQITVIPVKKRSFTISVVPDRSRRVDAASAEVHKASQPDRVSGAPSPVPPPLSGQTGDLSSNPFKLKTNPFPSGE